MKRWLALFIGLRYHRFGKRRGLIAFISRSSTIGIALGVAVLIIGLSVMNGFQRELNQRFLSVVNHGELVAARAPLREAEQLTQLAEQTPNVVAAAPFIELHGLLNYNGHLAPAAIRGIAPKRQLKVTNIKPYMAPETFSSLAQNKPGVVIGAGIAKKLGVKTGANITLMLAQEGVTNGKLAVPRRVRLPVLGTFQVNGQLDGELAFMALPQAQQIQHWRANEVSGISIRVTDPLQAAMVVRRVGMQYPQPVYAQSWTQRYGYLYQDIQMVKTIMYAIMLLIVAVASFNIVTTLILAVADKRRDLAILKTLGASDSLLIRCFIVYGGYNAIMGCFWGVVFGVLGSYWIPSLISFLERLTGHQLLSPDVYFIDFLPSELSWWNVVSVAGCAAAIGLIATIWPAFRARYIKPAQELSR